MVFLNCFDLYIIVNIFEIQDMVKGDFYELIIFFYVYFLCIGFVGIVFFMNGVSFFYCLFEVRVGNGFFQKISYLIIVGFVGVFFVRCCKYYLGQGNGIFQKFDFCDFWYFYIQENEIDDFFRKKFECFFCVFIDIYCVEQF